MTMTTRTTFLVIITILTVWFLYLARAILTPFIIAAIFAYILNPVIIFFTDKTKTPRMLYIIVLYVLLFSVLGWVGTFIAKQILKEMQELGGQITFLLRESQVQIAALPDWAQGYARESLISLQEATNIEPQAILPFFSGAASRIFAFITFLFASFYFLKDGEHFIDRLLFLLHKGHKLEAEKLLRKINTALGNYLRGQLSIVIIMATLGFIMFTILGVRFSLVLGLTIGLAEIVPMIGPIIAGTITILVAVFDDTSRFGLPPLYDGTVVLLAYVILNQLENYLIVPQVMGKAIDLHPLLIFFAVLAGGHLFGILGFILAVPILAVLRVFLEYLSQKFTS